VINHKKINTQIWNSKVIIHKKINIDLGQQVGILSTNLTTNSLHRKLDSTLRNPYRGLNTPHGSLREASIAKERAQNEAMRYLLTVSWP
jgi:hypothetical protein